MKVVNLPAPTKNGLVSRSAKPKFAKIGDDSFKTYSEIVPYKGDLPLISNIILEGSPPPFSKTRFARHSTMTKSRPPTPRLTANTPPSSKTRDSKRKTSHSAPSATTKRRVCYL